MNIEEILKAAGIEDAETVAKVRELMPKAYIPLKDHNERVAKAKAEAEAAQAALDEAQKAAEEAKAAEAAKAAGEGKADESAKALEELQAKLEKLQGEYNASQAELKSGKASKALEAALKEAGANPHAVGLLTASAAGMVEFGEDGKPSNVAEIADKLKADNGGLFGTFVDTGKQQQKGEGGKGGEDAFLAGFGKTE